MSWFDMISMTIAAVAALVLVARLAQLDRRIHAWSAIALHAGMAVACILGASLTFQGEGLAVLDAITTVIAGHLVLTLGDWRHGPPLQLRRDAGVYRGEPMPSRIDGER